MNGATKLKINNYIDKGKYLRECQNFSATGPPGSAGSPNVNLGPPNISESKRGRKLKLKTTLDIVTYSPRVQKISARGRRGGHKAPKRKFGTPLKSRKLLELEC